MILNSILSLNRYAKRAIAISTDIGLCIFCTWLAFALRLEKLILFQELNIISIYISCLIVIPIFWLFGIYRTIFRYTSIPLVMTIVISTFVYGFFYFLVIGVYGIKGVPRSIGILQPMLLFFGVLLSRLTVKYLLTGKSVNKLSNNKKKNVLIYGAGEAGRQLVDALENHLEFRVVGFLDDNKLLHRQVLLGQTIYNPLSLNQLLKNKDINFVFLALPEVGRNRRNEIIENLNQYHLTVKTLPSVSEIVDGRVTLSDIKDFNINDLLNREEVKPDINLLKKNITSKTVVVTGAGGSIGSELSRQIIKLKPSKLILIEINEFALYKINEELKILNENLKIIPLLLNSQNQKKLESIFEVFNVDTVYHAAAYKHVSLVEENICGSVKNNVFSTIAVAKASLNKKVSNLVLISSDKAVRPTNIMGASKRLSEICMQAIYNESKNTHSNFSIVRFGNVLESSGSVIPKFKKQLQDGGPITLTHDEVTRYFMTVTEAAQLVIQAGAMGKYSEVFVLDMGESIKIKSLIHKMIKLSGFSIRNEENKKGDIEIKIIGLRPGEKLYEELLLGENPQKTYHEKIQKTQDPFIPYSILKTDLDNLLNLIKENKVEEVKNLLSNIVSSYQSNSKIVDHFYNQQSDLKNDLKFPKIISDEENKVIKIKSK